MFQLRGNHYVVQETKYYLYHSTYTGQEQLLSMCKSTVPARLLLFTGSNCTFYPLEMKSKSKSVALLKLCVCKTLCKLNIGHKARSDQIGKSCSILQVIVLCHLCKRGLDGVRASKAAVQSHLLILD